MFVTHPDYIRQKARQMRIEKDLTIDGIAERLGISRQKIACWVRDLPVAGVARGLARQPIAYWVRALPLQRAPRANPGQRLGNLAMQRKFKALRDTAYEEGC